MKFALVEGWACHRPSGSHVLTRVRRRTPADQVLRLDVADIREVDRRVGQPVVGGVPGQGRLAGDRGPSS